MNETKALELFNFFKEEGYDLGDEQNFLSSFQDDSKRVELFDFFENEGYDVGKVEDFTLSSNGQVVNNQTQEKTEEQVLENIEVEPSSKETQLEGIHDYWDKTVDVEGSYEKDT